MNGDMPLPDFLQETEEEIHQRMLAGFPADISVTEGSFAWDTTRPAAIEKAELISMRLTEVMRTAFPQFSYGLWLRRLGALRGVWERPANKAQTSILVEAALGTSIPLGTIAIVPSDGIQGVIEFKTLARADVDETEEVDIPVEAVEGGVGGNVDAGTIIAFAQGIAGVRAVINLDPATGGTDAEEDESFRSRLLASYQEAAGSGSKSDYIRWAQEVAGVGQVFVIPEWGGPGTVKVTILDANGVPANQSIVNAVQEHIAPDNGDGLAPIGAEVTVAPPETTAINVSYTGVFAAETDPFSVNSEFIVALQHYFAAVGVGGEINYNKIGAVLIGLSGIEDYSDLLVNDGMVNTLLDIDKMAVPGVVEFNE